MGKRRSVVLNAVILGLVAITARAAMPTYDNLYVFGDSYCDVGNIFAATGGTLPSAPYYNGRFSNGPIWVDHVAGFLKVHLTPSLLGGTDYAFGKAWVTQGPSVTGVLSVPEQVETYLLDHAGKADPHALYILEGGGDDILGTQSGSPQVLGSAIAAGIVESELLLLQAGARHIVIPNLFDVGLLPAAAGFTSFASAASTATNKSVNALLALQGELPGVQIIRMDVFSLLKAVGTAPTHFGFTDITNPCVTTTLCADPDHTYFWDIYHPTEFGHAFFAVTLENALTQQE
jgi:outer membrane lipase/esterase